MIFLSRMKDEGIVIGDDIFITVKEIGGDKVQLDIQHPPGVAVQRRDAFDAIEQEAEASQQF